MVFGRSIDEVEVKRANIRHHDVEAEFFEDAHPEGSSLYERVKVSRDIREIVRRSEVRDVCIDVGCGTGFLTGFELPFYKLVVAADISRNMLRVVKRRFRGEESLNLLVCDADFLPFRDGVADLISVSSVLHHLPRPFRTLREFFRVLRRGGFIFINREPSYQRFRRFLDFFEYLLVRYGFRFLPFLRSRLKDSDSSVHVEGLDYSKVDVHYPMGFHFAQLSEALSSEGFEVLSAYSYHWIYPYSRIVWLRRLLTESNFLFERIPLSDRFGRYVSVVARKTC